MGKTVRFDATGVGVASSKSLTLKTLLTACVRGLQNQQVCPRVSSSKFLIDRLCSLSLCVCPRSDAKPLLRPLVSPRATYQKNWQPVHTELCHNHAICWKVHVSAPRLCFSLFKEHIPENTSSRCVQGFSTLFIFIKSLPVRPWLYSNATQTYLAMPWNYFVMLERSMILSVGLIFLALLIFRSSTLGLVLWSLSRQKSSQKINKKLKRKKERFWFYTKIIGPITWSISKRLKLTEACCTLACLSFVCYKHWC